ncbi:cohesin domain-containing protein [Peribacillus asahii]|uniref:cohesin domain-containing protein n=1 Tax=Peribacillus asahii TaxID=228899 RepID=UPI00380DEF5C
MMKKTLEILTMLLLAIGTLIGSPSMSIAGDSNDGILQYGNIQGWIGETVTIPVTISKPTEGIVAYNLEMGYDKEKLELLDVKDAYGSTANDCDKDFKGCFFSGFENEKGYVRVAWADPSAGDHSIKESTTLFKLEFKILKELKQGSLIIETGNPEHFNFSDSEGNALDFEWKEGKIEGTKFPEYTPTPITTPEKSPGKTPKPDPKPEPKPGNNDGVRVVPVQVTDGKSSEPAAKIEITRKTEANGTKKDIVTLDDKKTKEAVDKALKEKKGGIKIVITDIKNDKADVLETSVSKNAISILKKKNISLTIETSKGIVNVSSATIKKLKTNDTYFILKDVKDQKSIKTTGNVIKKLSPGAKQITKPIKVETNMKGKANITLPITKSMLPKQQKDMQKFVSSLTVVGEHSSKSNKTYKGKVVYDKNKQPVGLTISVEKYNTFTLISKKQK